jgi:hypothetical protein
MVEVKVAATDTTPFDLEQDLAGIRRVIIMSCGNFIHSNISGTV